MPFIQVTSVMIARVVVEEVGYDSGGWCGRCGCGEVVVGEEHAGEYLVGYWFDRFIWRNDSPNRETVLCMVVYERVYNNVSILRR